MAYNKKQLAEQALKAIKQYNIVFIEDVVHYIPCSKATFYNKKLDELDAIKEALDRNKVLTKASLRKKWNDSNDATRQIALYRLIGTPEERTALSQKVEVGGKGDKPIEVNQSASIEIDWKKMPDEVLLKLADLLGK